MANGRADLGLHPQYWRPKESTISKRKMVSEEIHHLEEVTHIATAVEQRKQGVGTKWENAKDRAFTSGDLKNVEPEKFSFFIKAVNDVLPTPVKDISVWALTTSDWCRAGWKTASLKHILTGCEYALKSYTWRHKVFEIFTEAAKICCETVNKALKNITNRAIHSDKEGNISKLSRKNKHRPSFLDGCMD